ncbi:DEAD/DEAH box helicase [Coralloluteibacterium thermophilus]|uniref:DEAD/DEAH box helicase n=1 Tax=Coralloluteibacterium thermophilum TaxID=2707049 RepID=A0ABV9NLC4_9GAMM
MQLRDYQQDIFEQLTASCSNDIVQLDTGAGKTPIEAALAQWAPHCLLVAHRNILITQISEKLAAFGLEHDTISTEHTRRRCMAAHRAHGRSFIVRGHATRRVASMQSIVSAVKHHRFDIDTSLPWLIVIDEAHHVIPDNMWGSLRTLFPHARIIGFTATPARMDGDSLHVDKGGLFDRLVQASSLAGDSVRALIDRGYLSGFRAYAARTSYNIEERMTWREREQKLVDDLTREAMGLPAGSGERAIFHAPRKGLDWDSGVLELMGDPVEEYKRVANGTRAILMAPAIKSAEAFAVDFRTAGIPAACINSTQSPAEIARLLDAFRRGQVLVLTNVDMVGEGFDLPACETLIIATRTASFPRYRQWCGRVLRPDPGKQQATIIDLTGMIAQHGMPDEPVEWDLLNPPCGPKTKRHVPCDDCGMFYLFKLEQCPECGAPNRWLDEGQAFAPGSYQFDIRYIDQAFRGYVIRERQQAQNAERMRTEMLRPYDGFGGDLVGRTLNALSAWFPAALQQAGVAIAEINEFLRSQDARSRDFWMKHFTRADVGAPPHRAQKVFEKWQRSR